MLTETMKMRLQEREEAIAEVSRLKHLLGVSFQATNCAACGLFKHTPWRGEEGYICAGCLGAQLNTAERERDAYLHMSAALIVLARTKGIDEALVAAAVDPWQALVEGPGTDKGQPEANEVPGKGGGE